MRDQTFSNRFDELWSLLVDQMTNADPQEADTAKTRADSLPPPTPQDTSHPDHSKSNDSRLDKRALKRLREIRRYASWHGEDGTSKLATARALFEAEFPDHMAAVEEVIAAGKSDAVFLDTSYKIGCRMGAKKEIHSLLKDLSPDDRPQLQKKIWNQYERGLAASQRWKQERRRKKEGKALSQVNIRPPVELTQLPDKPLQPRHEVLSPLAAQLHPNDIRALPPSAHWELLIDETGSAFDELQNVKNFKLGRFVGILAPDPCDSLPPLQKGWHAVECNDTNEIDRVMQAVLDAPVGVIGLDMRLVPKARGERWLDGVALLIDWVLRLLPIDGRTTLRVQIEQRGLFERGESWPLIRRDCIRRLALAYPVRATNIDLQINTIGKTENSRNGYVDAIAYSWAGSSDTSKERLQRSSLKGTCLLEGVTEKDARDLLYAWDAFTQGVNVPPSLWWDIVSSTETSNPASLWNAFLNAVGVETQSHLSTWHSFLTEVKSHMATSPVDLAKLAAAVDWLQRYQPLDSTLPPALRLVWLTIQLARANHMGEAELTHQRELTLLGEQLFEEAAPLVCHADLHLAVSATNRFDFETAKVLLKKWAPQSPAVPGLRYWAQIQSSLGQITAFMGAPGDAIPYFKRALDAFQRLSDPELRVVDQQQTGCYLAIATIDHPSFSKADVRSCVENVIGLLPEAASRLASSSAASDRYKHHLLLRWLLVSNEETLKQVYIESREKWHVGHGHPWPLIQLYRGFLLKQKDTKTAIDLAMDGARLAWSAKQGPTVRFIGVCCRAVAALWGKQWPDADPILRELEIELPMAKQRIEAIQTALNENQEPMGFLSKALPFNFR